MTFSAIIVLSWVVCFIGSIFWYILFLANHSEADKYITYVGIPLCLLIVIVLYILIYKSLKKKFFTENRPFCQQLYDFIRNRTTLTKPCIEDEKEIRIILRLSLIVFIASILWISVIIISLVQQTVAISCVRHIILLFSPLLNPLLYGFQVKKIREAGKKVLKILFCQRRNNLITNISTNSTNIENI